jgi:hypothetical protein
MYQDIEDNPNPRQGPGCLGVRGVAGVGPVGRRVVW